MAEDQQQSKAALTFGALGVVYGDLGTSPLYTLRACFGEHIDLSPTPDTILGILSLIFWTLMLVVSVKYVLVVLRADDRGEGGILTLMSLAVRSLAGWQKRWLILLGLAGAGLFFGDAVITPAMSVLSAVEGLEIVAPELEAFVLPIALGVLVALFLIQRFGTGRVGILFGPVLLIWFVVLGGLGLSAILKNPHILIALNPLYAVTFFLDHAHVAFLALGAVVLCVTGAEALYADMGHFGRGPIRLAWGSLVMPGLVLNYFGQGAEVMSDPAAIANPFFLLAPGWMVLPLVVLATVATVIASQAVISGMFSLVRQAIQMGFLPRMTIRHTSEKSIGQIYMPLANLLLLLAVVVVVLLFRSSDNLAAAYGIAVTGTMVITTLLLIMLGWERNRRLLPLLLLLGVPMLVIDLAFFGANIAKLLAGGWLPLLVAAAVLTVMTTWKRGRELVLQRLEDEALPFDLFSRNLDSTTIQRVSGTAVFMTSMNSGVPHALLHNLKHNKVLHERNVLMRVRTLDKPHVRSAHRVDITLLPNNFWRVEALYGYQETPHMNHILAACAKQGLEFDLMQTSFFLSHETLVSTRRPGMARWREKLFIWMSRNAQRATDFFHIPINRTIELGAQVEL